LRIWNKSWLDELREYIFENKSVATDFLKKRNSKIKVVPSEATYMLWLDCENIMGSADDLAQFIRQNTGLYLSAGRQYGKCGEAFMRMNVACTRETLLDGMERLNRGVELYEKWKDNHKWN
jgi:cystathionine beta-lyase